MRVVEIVLRSLQGSKDEPQIPKPLRPLMKLVAKSGTVETGETVRYFKARGKSERIVKQWFATATSLKLLKREERGIYKAA